MCDYIQKNLRRDIPLTKLEEFIMYELYLNSRVAIDTLVKKSGIAHNTLLNKIQSLKNYYQLHFTTIIDTDLLGFSESRIIAIKFDKVPELNLLKTIFFKDKFIQNAYLTSGDFDLIIYVIGTNKTEYEHWEFTFRIGLSRFKPKLYTSTLNHPIEGFIPINSNLIYDSKLKSHEKIILSELIKDSRIRIKTLAKIANISEMKVIYTIKRLRNSGIIKQFTTSIQKPDKRIYLFYSLNLTITEEHHPKLLLKLLDEIIDNENKSRVATDYSVVISTSGAFDSIYICNFDNGFIMDKRGPNFIKKIWSSESPIINTCNMVDVIVGQWPFNYNCYFKWKMEQDIEKKSPIRFKAY